MKTFFLALTVCCLISCSGSGTEKTLTLTNPAGQNRSDILVETIVPTAMTVGEQLTIRHGDSLLPTQVLDRNQDGIAESIAFLIDLAAGETKTVNLVQADHPVRSVPRAYAEISVKHDAVFEDGVYVGGKFKNIKEFRVPAEHVAHDGLIRYEGPGWESDKVAYRFYLDGRNAIDIFGKKTNAMVLPDIDTEDAASYHEMQPWGMDLLKVGNSLGIGSIAAFTEDSLIHFENIDSVHCRVRADGPVYAEVETDWFGWQPLDVKSHLTSVLSISAGKRITMHEIMTNYPGALCTGLVKNPGMDVIVSRSAEAPWEALATWGTQSLSSPQDSLGLALFYRKADVERLSQNDYSYIVVFKEALPEISYAFGACWDKEPSGITTKADFEKWIEQTLSELNQPVAINENN